jgi:hypothetical protein
MVLVSLVFLLVYLFGAYAYGAATLFASREAAPVWTHARPLPSGHTRIDRATFALFVVSTIWFVLHILIEFRNLTGDEARGFLDLGTFVVFAFPPLIMHTTYGEVGVAEGAAPAPVYRTLLMLMYLLSPSAGVYLIGAIFGVLPRPEPLGPWIGGIIGALFILASIYSTAFMLQLQRPARTPDQLKLRNVMILLFFAMCAVFVAALFMREQTLAIAIVDRVTRTSPIYFLVASVYFENRFAFYDIVVKRATLLLVSVIVLGSYFALALPWLAALPGGAARPWLYAVALAPVGMVMPPLVARLERWLDRIWLGREFTPVEAVKHVLAAMQPATDEASLVRAAEARLSEIFRSRIVILTGPATAGDEAIELEVERPLPLAGDPVRIAVVKAPGMRRILSEDLAMLRSLVSVFGFMLENIRLQRRRQEQDQLAHELRLQSSRSELKALRAQINPHFLFNALNAIASLIHTDPSRADEAVEQLAEVFRYTLRRSESDWAPLDQELAFARAYLDVEQARFGQRLTYTIDSDHQVPVPHVPSMLIQTLLENAVKHGVSQAREPGRIDVVARSTPDRITIEVRNTGPAADARGREVREGEGFGLHSVRERLKGHFGDRASFRLFRDETAGVTIARVDMPQAKVAA